MTRWFGICAGFAACAGMGLGIGRVAAAADAAAEPPGVIANFITAGTPDPRGKVPVLDGIHGAGVDNIAMASPLGILQHGQVYLLLLTSQNNTFRGNCADSYTLKQGASVLASGKIHSYACQPGTYWQWAAQTRAIPNKPGLATLTGTVTYGGKTATTTTTVLIK